MWLILFILTLVTLQRLAELMIATRNTQRLLEKGGYEAAGGQYPLIVAFHAAWLLGLWYFAWGNEVQWPWFVAYLVIEAARGWVIATLGERWTTRVIVVPGEELVTRGPYRFLKHPNYLVVALEVFILPMAFGLWWYALAFGIANLVLLWWRIRAEDEALAEFRRPQPPSAAA
jgi:methyltransferase